MPRRKAARKTIVADEGDESDGDAFDSISISTNRTEGDQTREQSEEEDYESSIENELDENPSDLEVEAPEDLDCQIGTDEENSTSDLTSPVTEDTQVKKASSFKTCISMVILVIAIISSLLLRNSSQNSVVSDAEQRTRKIDFGQIDKMNQKYPGLFSAKQIRTIKTRLAVMQREVSILMLLGRSRDNHCKLDPTFCIGKTIANVTQVTFSYFDASDPHLEPVRVQQQLEDSLVPERGHTVLIDSLEQLPGTEVMRLFQFIDKDETHKRRGMVLFVVYTGKDLPTSLENSNDAYIAEKILVDKWSPYIPKDSLTSVISRLCGSIVKVY